ncbi:protocadherin gamma-C3-like [Centropristis striata]|uniref:protocadherin gamma-C3-like n=1 Tax=Centropristis striata TaxID=184440 RepID=UPI0027DFFB0F|nr:protocadherin gamma-C3-like [Centropristis striata]
MVGKLMLKWSARVHDFHSLDSKGRCWSVKQLFRVESVEAQPSFFPLRQERRQSVLHKQDYGHNFIQSEDFKIQRFLDVTAFFSQWIINNGLWVSPVSVCAMAFEKSPHKKWRLHCRSVWPLLLFLWCLSHIVSGQIRYTIPEELKKGALIGNVAQDLGLDVQRLRSGRARIVTRQSIQYTELKTDKGVLIVNERIDREQLCGDVTPCSFSFEVILENPMELHRVTVEITDINDNSPTFRKDEIKFEISESATLGSRFLLASAEDADVGSNGLQKYILTTSDIFGLKQHSTPDGRKYAEMILQKPLDRESEPRITLKLVAVDGGTPPRSGTVNIDITVLDANDNPPIFNQSLYRATVSENALKGTYITTVNASDADSGSNGFRTYRFSNMKEQLADIFHLDETTGIVTLVGQVDYEKDKKI